MLRPNDPGAADFPSYIREWLHARVEDPALIVHDLSAWLTPGDVLSVIAVPVPEQMAIVEEGPCEIDAPHCHLSSLPTINPRVALLRETLDEDQCVALKGILSVTSALHGIDHDDALCALVQTFVVVDEFRRGVPVLRSRFAPSRMNDGPYSFASFLRFVADGGSLWVERFIHETAHHAPERGITTFAWVPPVFLDYEPDELDALGVKKPLWVEHRLHRPARDWVEYMRSTKAAGLNMQITVGAPVGSPQAANEAGRVASANPVRFGLAEEKEFTRAAFRSRSELHLSARKRDKLWICELGAEDIGMGEVPYSRFIRLLAGVFTTPEGWVALARVLDEEDEQEGVDVANAIQRIKDSFRKDLRVANPEALIERDKNRFRVSTHPRCISWDPALANVTSPRIRRSIGILEKARAKWEHARIL